MTRQPIAILDTTGPRPPAKAAIRRPRRGLAALRGVQGFRRVVQAVRGALHRVGRDRSGDRGRLGRDRRRVPSRSARSAASRRIVTFLTAGFFVPHVHSSNLVLAIAVLVLAFLARGAFCGWICPLGFLQDLVAGFSAFVQRHVPAAFRGMRALRRKAAPLAVLDRPLRFLKYAVLVWAIWGTAVFGVMVFRDVDPWIAVLHIGQESVGFGMAILRPDPGRRAVRRPALVPVRVPARRRERPRRPVQPGAPRALGCRMRGLQPVHQELSHGPAGRHGDRHHLGRLQRLPRVRRGVSRVTAPSSSASAFPSAPGHEQGDDQHGPHGNHRATPGLAAGSRPSPTASWSSPSSRA